MSRRDQIRMTDEEVRVFLNEGRELQVASINRDGTPHLVSMWYLVGGDGRLGFWTYGKSQKVLNVRRDPRVTTLVSAGETYEELMGVTVGGAAEIVDDRDAVLAFGEQVYERYWGPITDDVVREGVAVTGAKRVLIWVPPTTVVSWDHTKLGGTY